MQDMVADGFYYKEKQHPHHSHNSLIKFQSQMNLFLKEKPIYSKRNKQKKKVEDVLIDRSIIQIIFRFLHAANQLSEYFIISLISLTMLRALISIVSSIDCILRRFFFRYCFQKFRFIQSLNALHSLGQRFGSPKRRRNQRLGYGKSCESQNQCGFP